MFCPIFLTLPSSVLFLWAESMQPIHLRMMMPLSPDCLAASHRYVITSMTGSRQEGSQRHKVMLACWITAPSPPQMNGSSKNLVGNYPSNKIRDILFFIEGWGSGDHLLSQIIPVNGKSSHYCCLLFNSCQFCEVTGQPGWQGEFSENSQQLFSY